MAGNSEGTIDVLLANDLVILLDSVRLLLEAQGDVKVVAAVRDGDEAVRLAKDLRPDVAVLGITLPRLNGIEATRRIRELSPATRILILSVYEPVHHVYEAFEAGADGYLAKESGAADMVDAVRTVRSGLRYVTPSFAGSVLNQVLQNRGAPNGPLKDLTSRERQVLSLVVEGKSSAGIAQELSLSRKTVETYRARIMQKLGISDLPALVKFAIRHGVTVVS